MLIEAFFPSQVNCCNGIHLPLPLTTHRDRATSLFAKVAASADAIPTTALVDYDEDLRRYVVTVPPFIPLAGPIHRNEDDGYPSPLHRIHVQPLLTDEETSELLRLARAHAAENRSWDRQDSSRHVSYPTVDFAVEESMDMSQYLGEDGIRFEERIFDALSEAYDVDTEDMSFLDLFCASYEAEATAENNEEHPRSEDGDRNTMDRLDFHRDGSLLSFTVLLSPLGDFEGGGTIFDALGDVVDVDQRNNSILQPSGVIQPPHAGYATLHSGKLLHGGHRVTSGQRIVIVGFVDVDERNVKSGALGAATKEWGRNDVRSFWNQRRLSLLARQEKNDDVATEGTTDGQHPRWKLKNWRYLPKANGGKSDPNSHQGRSHLGSEQSPFVMPTSILNNIEDRASLGKIRRRRLRSEDKLLRDILLPRVERGEKVAQEEEGEWMEVDLDDMSGLMLGWDGENEKGGD